MKGRRDYSIVHFPEENERSIKRTKEQETQWLSNSNGERVWTIREDRAKRFFHEETATSALIITRRRGEKTPIISARKYELGGREEKTSWSEL